MTDQVEATTTLVDDGGCPVDDLRLADAPWNGAPQTWPVLTEYLEFREGGGFGTEFGVEASCGSKRARASASFQVLPATRGDVLAAEITGPAVRDQSVLVGCGPDGDVVERSLVNQREVVHLDVPCDASTRIEAQTVAASGFVVRNGETVTWVWRPPMTGVPEVAHEVTPAAGEVVFASDGVILREEAGRTHASLLDPLGVTEIDLGPATDFPIADYGGRAGGGLTFVSPEGRVYDNSGDRGWDATARQPGSRLWHGWMGATEVVQLIDPAGDYVVFRNRREEHRVPGAVMVDIPGAPWGAWVTDEDGATWLAWGHALEPRAPAGVTIRYGNDDHWVGETSEGETVLGWLDIHGTVGPLFDGSVLLPTLPLFPSTRVSESQAWALHGEQPWRLDMIFVAAVGSD